MSTIVASKTPSGDNLYRASDGALDLRRIREDFPILRRDMHCKVQPKPLVYLDNAATSQKPVSVIRAISRFYEEECSNIHRGVYQLSARATDLYEHVRAKTQRFLNAADSREIVFTRGTTEAINLVAQTFGRLVVREGDEILITAMEHHSNIVPWQMLRDQTGAKLKVAPINDDGELIVEEYLRLLSPRTKLVALTHVSNALGTINPVRDLVAAARDVGAATLIDGAQAVPHLQVDVQELGCDFYAFSGHKVYGPTGIGVLYGKLDRLVAMPPYHGGGDMILSVTFDKSVYQEPPFKFEAGTPNISGTIGLGAALDYIQAIGFHAIAAHEQELVRYAAAMIAALPGFRVIGTAREKTGVVSFVHEIIHAHDIGTILDQYGVAIRTGHHCAQPLMDRFGVPATARASFAVYNTMSDIDTLGDALRKVVELFA